MADYNAIFFKGSPEDNRLGYILAEIYKDGIYTPIFMSKKDLTIFDIGANIGLTSMLFTKVAKDVYAVEPAQEHFDTMNKNLEYNKITNVHPLKYAIGNENKKMPFYHYPNKTGYNLFELPEKTDSELVDMITIDKLFEITKVKKVDFVKLDTEGSEFSILGGTGFNKVAPLIDSILVEIHEWVGRNFNQIKDSLRVNGFKVREIPNGAHLLYGYK